MSEMNMREKLARALYARRFQNRIPWERHVPQFRDELLADADAVLDVLAEPDEGMVDAGVRVHKAGQSPRNVFVEMIDAARTPGAIEETGRRRSMLPAPCPKVRADG